MHPLMMYSPPNQDAGEAKEEVLMPVALLVLLLVRLEAHTTHAHHLGALGTPELGPTTGKWQDLII